MSANYWCVSRHTVVSTHEPHNAKSFQRMLYGCYGCYGWDGVDWRHPMSHASETVDSSYLWKELHALWWDDVKVTANSYPPSLSPPAWVTIGSEPGTAPSHVQCWTAASSAPPNPILSFEICKNVRLLRWCRDWSLEIDARQSWECSRFHQHPPETWCKLSAYSHGPGQQIHAHLPPRKSCEIIHKRRNRLPWILQPPLPDHSYFGGSENSASMVGEVSRYWLRMVVRGWVMIKSQVMTIKSTWKW